MIISEEILEKVEKKEKEDHYTRRCLAVKVCPNCGETLTYRSYKHGGGEYTCDSCSFEYNT